MHLKRTQFLLGSMVILVALGVVMLTSTSLFLEERTNLYLDWKKHFIWLGLGTVSCVFFAMLDYRVLQRLAWPILAIAILLLGLCYVPNVGMRLNEANRWIGLHAVGLPAVAFQPSELVKIAVVVFLASWYACRSRATGPITHSLVIPMAAVSLPLGLLTFQPDIGSGAILGATVLAVLFVAGIRWYWFAGLFVSGAVALAIVVSMNANRMERIMAFQDLESHSQNLGHQQWRGLIALGNGGMFGTGLANGREKLMFLTYVHTDCMFPNIGEELGFVGSSAVLVVFGIFLLSAVLILQRVPDRFGKLLGVGLISCFMLQATIHIGVTSAVLPNKGLPLPFISYGGSNLLFCFSIAGILLSLARHSDQVRYERPVAMPVRYQPHSV